MRTVVVGTLALALAGVLVGCGGSAVNRREDIIRSRQYELDSREARLRAAERRFEQCVARRYPGEDPGLRVPAPAAGGGAEAARPEAMTAGDASGSLGPSELEEVERTLRAGMPAVEECYVDELERRGNKELEGKVVVKILIGTNGRAQQVVIGSSTLAAPRVHACITKTIMQWDFPQLERQAWYSKTLHLSPAY